MSSAIYPSPGLKLICLASTNTLNFCLPSPDLESIHKGTAQAFFFLTHRIYIAIFPALFAAVATYFALVLKMGGLNRYELYEFPMGRSMSVIADKFHLLKQ